MAVAEAKPALARLHAVCAVLVRRPLRQGLLLPLPLPLPLAWMRMRMKMRMTLLATRRRALLLARGAEGC